MTRRRICWLVLVLVALTAGAGCGGTTDIGTDSGTGTTMASGTPAGSVPPGTAGSNGLAGTSWVLLSYQGAGGNQTGAAAGGTSTLEFGAGDALTGNTGCNQFTGTYTTTGIDLKISVGPMTRRACDADLTAQEVALTKLLPTVTTFRRPASALTLMAGDTVVATYKPGLSSLEGTSWTVTGVNNGRGGVEANTLTSSLSATFGPNAEFSGTACNNLTGEYHTTGTDGLVIGRLASTMMACPPEKMALETQYVNALGQVSTYAISGDTLTLRDRGGATQVTLVRKP